MTLVRAFLAAVGAATAMALAGCGEREPFDASGATPTNAVLESAPTASPPVTPEATGRSAAPQAATPARPAAPVSLGTPAPAIEARAVLVVDERSGKALHEVNARQRLAPASLTKIATAVVVLESDLPLDRILDVNPDLEKQWLEDSAVMGLLPGDRFAVRELLFGLLMVSGADAATELAVATAGTEHAFVARMNALAERLGLRDSRFSDVHGLGGEDQYSSAWDLAVLSQHAMTFPLFRQIVGIETYTPPGTQELPLYNHNPLLNYTAGVDGVKTGYTEEAGRTFVASAERNGHRILVVLLDSPAMPFDAIALIDWAFANHMWQ